MRKKHQELVLNHYTSVWGKTPKTYIWSDGPSNELPFNFRVLEFPPSKNRNMWTYATLGMSQPNDLHPMELHVFSRERDESLTELLTIIAHYHRTSVGLNLNHSVNLGRPWKEGSNCTFGFISLPYLDGPSLENLDALEGNKTIKFFWLIPITDKELNIKKSKGVDALEEYFETNGLNYLDR